MDPQLKPINWNRSFGNHLRSLATLWTALVLASAIFNLIELRKAIEEGALVLAHIVLNDEIVYKYLAMPSHFTRQVFPLQYAPTGIVVHLVGDKAGAPDNQPDAWEEKTLELLKNGSQEYSQVVNLAGSDHLLLMRPLSARSECLECHQAQAAQVGDMIGGVSVRIPFAALRRAQADRFAVILIGHSLLWGIGLAGIFYVSRRLHSQLENSVRAEQKLLHLNLFDPQTGLPNRSYLENALQQIDVLHEKPITVLAAGVDSLKSADGGMGVADRELLAECAGEVIKQSFRSLDIIARTGDGEFVVILPDTRAEEIEWALKRVEDNLVQHRLEHAGCRLSLSIGAATTDVNLSLPEIYKRADERMVEAKTRKQSLPE